MSLGEENFANARQVHERSIQLADGKKHTLWFRELSNVDVRRWAVQRQSSDVDLVAASDARLVSLSLCDAGGQTALTFERACALKAAVLDRLVGAVLDVNELSQAVPSSEGNGSTPEPNAGSGIL